MDSPCVARASLRLNSGSDCVKYIRPLIHPSVRALMTCARRCLIKSPVLLPPARDRGRLGIRRAQSLIERGIPAVSPGRHTDRRTESPDHRGSPVLQVNTRSARWNPTATI